MGMLKMQNLRYIVYNEFAAIFELSAYYWQSQRTS